MTDILFSHYCENTSFLPLPLQDWFIRGDFTVPSLHIRGEGISSPQEFAGLHFFGEVAVTSQQRDNTSPERVHPAINRRKVTATSLEDHFVATSHGKVAAGRNHFTGRPSACEESQQGYSNFTRGPFGVTSRGKVATGRNHFTGRPSSCD